jgi:hypothetical protein
MDGMTFIPDRPDTSVPRRPDLRWLELPPAVAPRRSRRRVTATIALLTALAVAITLGGLGAAVNESLTPRGRSDEYDFLAVFGGEPVRWNPCEPIHYVVNATRAPDGSSDDVHEAVARVSAATGISFIYDGPSDEIPRAGRRPYLPTQYGDRWAPLIIAWAYQSQTDIAFHQGDEHYAAVARPTAPPDGTPQFVSGWIVVNAADPNPPGWSSPDAQGPTVLHELGHVMGLDHVDSRAELMEPSGGYMTDFGPGDRAGLALLGRSQGCLPPAELPG